MQSKCFWNSFKLAISNECTLGKGIGQELSSTRSKKRGSISAEKEAPFTLSSNSQWIFLADNLGLKGVADGRSLLEEADEMDGFNLTGKYWGFRERITSMFYTTSWNSKIEPPSLRFFLRKRVSESTSLVEEEEHEAEARGDFTVWNLNRIELLLF